MSYLYYGYTCVSLVLRFWSKILIQQPFKIYFMYLGSTGSSQRPSGSVLQSSGSVASGYWSLVAQTCEICFSTRDQTHVPRIGRRILNHWTTSEVLIPQSWYLPVIFLTYQKVQLCLSTTTWVNSFDGWRFRPGVSSRIDSHQAWVPGQLDFAVTTWLPELGNWLGWSWFTSHRCLFKCHRLVEQPEQHVQSRCQFNSQDCFNDVCPGAYPLNVDGITFCCYPPCRDRLSSVCCAEC